MRKIHLLTCALCAVCALGIVASSAFGAETLPAEFLWETAKIAEGAKLAIDTTNVGETLLLLEDMEAVGGAVDVLCSGLFGGEIMGPKDALVTEVVSLTGTKIITCELMTNGACSGTTAEVEAIHLPWLIEPLLVEPGLFALDIVESSEDKPGLPGYAVTCSTILGKQTDTCTGATGAEAFNVTGGVEGVFSETSEEITPTGTCTLSGNKKSGLLAGAGLTTDTTGGTLTISE